ncbi:MAG TPA: hypothetical protein V6D10_19210 [Trichocoleus sp.]
MQYSLVNRFRGAFLGAALGTVLGRNCSRSAAQSWQMIEQWGFSDISPASEVTGGQFIVQQAQRIIQAPHSPHLPEANPESAEFLLALLPLMLFYHDTPEQIQLLSSHQTSAAILTLSNLLSAILQEQFHLDRLLPQLLHRFAMDQTDPAFTTQLQQVQSCLVQSCPLTDSALLSLSPLCLALSAFFQTPTDFRLSLLRSAQISTQPEITCTITGFLSGAHLSLAGIPIGWRRILDRSMPSSPLSFLWGFADTTALLTFAEQFWAAWSGAFQPEQWIQEPMATTITAAPHLIRPR